MLYTTRITGTRSVPMKSRLEGMGLYQPVESKQDTASFQQHEQEQREKQQQAKKKMQKKADHMQKLVEAENTQDVQKVSKQLQGKRADIEKSTLSEQKKREALKHLQQMQTMCDKKLQLLQKESMLQQEIEAAEEQGDEETVAYLVQQYSREKNLRKAGEYASLQNSIKRADQKFQMYSASQQGINMMQEMNGKGNFVNVISKLT